VTSPPPIDRLRFEEFELERLPNGRCSARVLLTFRGNDRYSGQSDGLTSPAGELRCAAQACLEALQDFTGTEVRLELLGVKAVRAFDSTVVIVSVAAHGDPHGARLIGSYLTDGDAARGAALAVLNATNRILGNGFFMR
jgi:hypothetical protein